MGLKTIFKLDYKSLRKNMEFITTPAKHQRTMGLMLMKKKKSLKRQRGIVKRAAAKKKIRILTRMTNTLISKSPMMSRKSNHQRKSPKRPRKIKRMPPQRLMTKRCQQVICLLLSSCLRVTRSWRSISRGGVRVTRPQSSTGWSSATTRSLVETTKPEWKRFSGFFFNTSTTAEQVWQLANENLTRRHIAFKNLLTRTKIEFWPSSIRRIKDPFLELAQVCWPLTGPNFEH